MRKKYGISYLGSKSDIINLIHLMFERESNKQYFIDPFCGGFAVCEYALRHTNFKVLANDLNAYVIELYKEVFFNNAVNLKNVLFEWVSREKFHDVRRHPENYPKWYVGYVLTHWSFGCDQSSYIYNNKNELEREKFHNALVKDKWSEDLLWIKNYIDSFPKEYSRNKRVVFCKISKNRIRHLEHIDNLIDILKINTPNLIHLSSLDWFDFINSIPENILKDSFIYCDPPYKDTKNYMVKFNDYEKLWNWFENCDYPVYISSFNAPEHIKPLYSCKRLNKISRKGVIEHIYFNGKGVYSGGIIYKEVIK